MSKKKKIYIKNIINKKIIDKAPTDFTDKVMQDVFLLTNEESLKDAKLTSLLKRTIIERPSGKFVTDTITQVETHKKIEFQPLISKKGWYLIWGIAAVFILLVVFSDSSSGSNTILDKITPYLNNAENFVESLLSNPFKGIKSPPLLIMSILCFSTLLLLDAFLKKRNVTNF